MSYVLDDYALQYEEHTPTKVAPQPKLRVLVIGWLFSDVDFTKGTRTIHMDSDEDVNES